MSDTPYYAPGHRAGAVRQEPLATSLLWRLTKDGHVAEARLRPIDRIGLELRCEWNGELRWSQVFRSWAELEPVAETKRQELLARGWAA